MKLMLQSIALKRVVYLEVINLFHYFLIDACDYFTSSILTCMKLDELRSHRLESLVASNQYKFNDAV